MSNWALNYYRKTLPGVDVQVYDRIYLGWEKSQQGIALPLNLPNDYETNDIVTRVAMDHPEIFYTVSFKWQFAREASHVDILPEYLFPKSKVEEHRKALSARVQKLVRPAASLSEWEKEAYIHDFICRNVRYDKLKKPYSHEIIGPLGQLFSRIFCAKIVKNINEN